MIIADKFSIFGAITGGEMKAGRRCSSSRWLQAPLAAAVFLGIAASSDAAVISPASQVVTFGNEFSFTGDLTEALSGVSIDDGIFFTDDSAGFLGWFIDNQQVGSDPSLVRFFEAGDVLDPTLFPFDGTYILEYRTFVEHAVNDAACDDGTGTTCTDGFGEAFVAEAGETDVFVSGQAEIIISGTPGGVPQSGHLPAPGAFSLLVMAVAGLAATRCFSGRTRS